MTLRFLRLLLVSASLSGAASVPLAAQKKPATKAKTTVPALVGTWIGKATVQLGDSTIVVPVTYNFTQAGTVVGGTALVPGQGTGPISNVIREGTRVRFRVTAPEARLLEHDGKFGTDGTIEGIVNLNDLPVAKFKINPKK